MRNDGDWSTALTTWPQPFRRPPAARGHSSGKIRLGWIRWAELIGWSNSDWPNGGHVMFFWISQFNRLRVIRAWCQACQIQGRSQEFISEGINFNWGAQWNDIESLLGHRKKRTTWKFIRQTDFLWGALVQISFANQPDSSYSVKSLDQPDLISC